MQTPGRGRSLCRDFYVAVHQRRVRPADVLDSAFALRHRKQYAGCLPSANLLALDIPGRDLEVMHESGSVVAERDPDAFSGTEVNDRVGVIRSRSKIEGHSSRDGQDLARAGSGTP